MRAQRVIVSLPQPLVGELRQFASIFRAGNKSGFVADALRTHIEHLRKRRHTVKLRESYAAAAAETRISVEAWEPLAEEAWAKLDALEAKAKKET